MTSPNSMIDPAGMARGVEELQAICRIAWKQGMMAGWSGNASMRLESGLILITAAGSAKGSLRPCDCVLVDISGEIRAGSRRPSSEGGMHLAIYRAFEQCCAILHGHPTHLQALNAIMDEKTKNVPDRDAVFQREFLNLPLFEADVWKKRLFFAPSLAPGSSELARAAAAPVLEAQKELEIKWPCAVWLRSHGLCAAGRSLSDALCLSEELEHLAAVRLACMAARPAH